MIDIDTLLPTLGAVPPELWRLIPLACPFEESGDAVDILPVSLGSE